MGERVAANRFLRMPGVQALEDKLLLGTAPANFESQCDEVSQKLFGITRWDIASLFDGMTREQMIVEYHTKFAIENYVYDDDKVDYLKTLGWDFTDNIGRPLNVMPLFCLQAEAIARGYFAPPTNLHEVSAETWGSSLEAAAKNFQKQKRDRR
jgi:hypothetical protein